MTYGDSLGLFQRLREIIVADLSGYPQVRLAFEGILAEQGGANQGSVALTRALMTSVSSTSCVTCPNVLTADYPGWQGWRTLILHGQ